MGIKTYWVENRFDSGKYVYKNIYSGNSVIY